MTEALSDAGVAPLDGETDSQLPPLVVAAAAVNEMGALLLVTEMFWGAGGLFPVWAEKASDAGEAESTGAELTVSVTGTVSGLFDA